MGGYEYVLIDQSTEALEDLDFLEEISSQPIVLEEFVAISLDDFVRLAQEDIIYTISFNLRERENGESESLEWKLKDGIYI